MLRSSSLRIPVAFLAAGTLLCGCAASTTSTPVSAPAKATPHAAPSLPILTIPGLSDPNTATRDLSKLPKPDKTVYLTFDDGPSSAYTKQVLALLDEYDAKATFFIIGRQTKHAKATLRAEYAAGHGVANHTWNHRNLRKASAKKFKSEVGRTQTALKAATGHAPVCLRPPGGATSKKVTKRAKKYGLHIKLWTLDTYDWKHPGAKKIAARVLKHTKDGSIVLMHDGGGDRTQTIAALPTILNGLRARGYRFAAMCR